MGKKIIKYLGRLTRDGGRTFLMGNDGTRYFETDHIWRGYLDHWLDREVWGRHLPQKDYENGRYMVILWPAEPYAAGEYVDLYYNERLLKYRMSFFGHNAVNVNGQVFNFSVTLNENEVMTPEEYLYRPALGEFAPDPETGGHSIADPSRPYYDKFGRRFMRTVHVLRMTGMDVNRVGGIFNDELQRILSTSPDPKKPGIYRDFNMLTRNCTTIIRDGLRRAGLAGVRGVLPRDLFVSAASACAAGGIHASVFRLPQLLVEEAAPSVLSPPLNPLNMIRKNRIRYEE